MEIIITIGALTTGKTEKEDVYGENSRCAVKVSNENVKIKHILEQFKQEQKKQLAGTENEWELRYQDGCYFETAEARKILDSDKKLADFKLGSGTFLRVFTKTR